VKHVPGGSTAIYPSAALRAGFGAIHEKNLNANASEIDLLLKAQSSTTYQDGVLEVWCDPGAQHVQVVTYDACRRRISARPRSAAASR
jgi:hypothetical protein